MTQTMLPAALLALAQRLRDQAATLAPNATREDMLEAARYLRACAGAEPVATVRVHDTGGNAGIAWTGVPTENAGVMRGGTPLYEHPQPPSTQAEPVAWRITDGEGGYDYRDDPPEDWQVAWVARWGRKHEPLYTQPHPQPPSAQPTLTAEIVERRLRTWRQRFVNRSGDQLALGDFLDRESLDDLVDFVCDEYSKEAKR